MIITLHLGILYREREWVQKETLKVQENTECGDSYCSHCQERWSELWAWRQKHDSCTEELMRDWKTRARSKWSDIMKSVLLNPSCNWVTGSKDTQEIRSKLFCRQSWWKKEDESLPFPSVHLNIWSVDEWEWHVATLSFSEMKQEGALFLRTFRRTYCEGGNFLLLSRSVNDHFLWAFTQALNMFLG